MSLGVSFTFGVAWTERLTPRASHLTHRLRRVESEELGQLATALRILMNTQFDVLAKGSVELAENTLVL
jgi:hypothetical protein